jgi:hypothetical protein
MGILILLGVIVGGTIVMLGIFRMMSENRSGPVTPMVRIAIANGTIEADMWAQRLQHAGILCRIQGIGAEGSIGAPYYRPAYDIEVWVRADDEEEARELLGLRD